MTSVSQPTTKIEEEQAPQAVTEEKAESSGTAIPANEVEVSVSINSPGEDLPPQTPPSKKSYPPPPPPYYHPHHAWGPYGPPPPHHYPMHGYPPASPGNYHHPPPHHYQPPPPYHHPAYASPHAPHPVYYPYPPPPPPHYAPPHMANGMRPPLYSPVPSPRRGPSKVSADRPGKKFEGDGDNQDNSPGAASNSDSQKENNVNDRFNFSEEASYAESTSSKTHGGSTADHISADESRSALRLRNYVKAAHGTDPSSLERRERKNYQSRSRAAKLREKMEDIEQKPAEDRTEEEQELLNTYQGRRSRKNDRSRQRALEKKEEYDRIFAKPEHVRTKHEHAFMDSYLKTKKRKNEGDRLRRQRLKALGISSRNVTKPGVPARGPIPAHLLTNGSDPNLLVGDPSASEQFPPPPQHYQYGSYGGSWDMASPPRGYYPPPHFPPYHHEGGDQPPHHHPPHPHMYGYPPPMPPDGDGDGENTFGGHHYPYPPGPDNIGFSPPRMSVKEEGGLEDKHGGRDFIKMEDDNNKADLAVEPLSIDEKKDDKDEVDPL